VRRHHNAAALRRRRGHARRRLRWLLLVTAVHLVVGGEGETLGSTNPPNRTRAPRLLTCAPRRAAVHMRGSRRLDVTSLHSKTGPRKSNKIRRKWGEFLLGKKIGGATAGGGETGRDGTGVGRSYQSDQIWRENAWWDGDSGRSQLFVGFCSLPGTRVLSSF
jgi:hypothetical protein